MKKLILILALFLFGCKKEQAPLIDEHRIINLSETGTLVVKIDDATVLVLQKQELYTAGRNVKHIDCLGDCDYIYQNRRFNGSYVNYGN